MTPPSAYAIEQAMSVAQATAARMAADGVEFGDEAELLATLADAGADVGTIITRMIRAAMEADSLADAAAERVRVLTERKARFARQRDSYRAAAFAMMDALGLRTLKEADFTATISAGRPSVVVTDEAAIPADYLRVTTTIDKAALAAAMRVGEVIAGAEWSNPMPSLTIRSR